MRYNRTGGHPTFCGPRRPYQTRSSDVQERKPEHCEGDRSPTSDGNGDRRQSSAYPSRRRPEMPTIPASSGCGLAARCGRGIGMEYECDLIQIRNRLEQQVLLALLIFTRRGVARRIANVSFAGGGVDEITRREARRGGGRPDPGINMKHQKSYFSLVLERDQDNEIRFQSPEAMRPCPRQRPATYSHGPTPP